MSQLDVVVSSKGTVSELFADETRAPDVARLRQL